VVLVGACGPRGGTGDDAPDRPDASEAVDAPPSDAPPQSAVVQCPTPVPAATSGVCDAVDGTGTAVIVRGDVLADGTVYADGEVVYDGARITCVGCDCSATAGYDAATRISCAGAAISPGLIDAHTHMNFNNRSPLSSTAAGGTRYDNRKGWRDPVPTPSNQAGIGATSAGMRWNELRQIFAGTTSTIASTSAAELVRNFDDPESRDTSLGFPTVTYETFILRDSGAGPTTPPPADCNWNYKYSELAASLFPALVTHTSEGIDNYAHEEFRCQSASLFGARDYTERKTAHIHGIGLTATDYYNMARDQTKLVWSPRSNIALYGNTADAALFKRLGGVVALGTDWTYSGSANMSREMTCAQQLSDTAFGGAFTAEDIWKMATKHAALANNVDELIGTLETGKVADLAVFARGATPYHQSVIDADSRAVVLTVQAGRLLYAEVDVATALGESCDPVDVCGDSRQVCASRESGGTTFAQIEAAIDATTPAVYPAIFCAAPANEPTCVPSRPGQYNGPTATDPDGDGIVTGDNCPGVFNPIRPMDAGVQPDSNGDGIGDACDPSPLARDLDADGTDNSTDVCPFVPDPSQADNDGDDKGDACDACPTTPNPIGVCGPSTVSVVDIQNGTIPPGSTVELHSLVVTAIQSGRGFFAQDPTIADGRFAAIYVYLGVAPTVAIGDVVDLRGNTLEYFDLTEIEDVEIMGQTPGSALTPKSITVAQALDEAYEGVLVTLTDVTAVDLPYSCAGDDPDATTPCSDGRLFELNNSVLAWDGRAAAGTSSVFQGGEATWNAEAAAADADGSPTVTGVMSYRYLRRRILPRSDADITP
jgi:hypothetical protein